MAHLLALSDYWWGWGNLLFRWLHVIAAMAWIGASFYFIALDNHLEPPRDPADARRGVGGEAWEIHGGGFYRVEKFKVAPERLPEPLHWFKWEAYTTWLSGFALFIVVYYSHATSYLIDTTVADLTAWEAIALSVGGIDEIRLGMDEVDDDEQRKARQPRRVGLPLEPVEGLGKHVRRDLELLDAIEAAAVDLPRLAADPALGVIGILRRLEVVVERDEVKGRADPRHRGDHVQPAEEQVAPAPPVVAER
jgi:hypothetical protein